MSDIKGLSNSTAYSISTRDGDSTVYASAFPVKKLNECLRLSEVSDFLCLFEYGIEHRIFHRVHILHRLCLNSTQRTFV